MSANPSQRRASRTPANEGTERSDTLATAMKILTKYTLVLDDKPSATHLLSGMKHLADTAKSKTDGDCIRALATYVEYVLARTDSKILATMLVERLEPVVNILESGTAAMRVENEETRRTIEQVTVLMDTFRTETQNAVKTIETLASQQATATASPTGSYAAVTASGLTNTVHSILPTSHATTLVHEDVKLRQVLLDGVIMVDERTGEWLSEEVLLKKAELVLDLMGDLAKKNAPGEGKEVRFRGLRILANEGLLYELNSSESASWLRNQDVKTVFLKYYGGGDNACFKDRTWQLLLDYTPVTLNVSDSAVLQAIEERNNLPLGTLKEAKWIKPPEYRTPKQRTALLLLGLSTVNAANQILRDGIHICGKKLTARKHTMEPRRCLKYQHLGARHFPAECKSIHDTCDTCGSINHATRQCEVLEPDEYRCVNCDMAGHASWDRLCPAFLREKQKLEKRQPDLKYRFFPVATNPSTWELIDEIQSLL